MNSTVTRWVFFNFTDTSDNVFIAEPSLALPTTIPTGAQSATISFGPQFQSTSNSWTVTNGDPRFNAWANGPGNFTGTFKAYFTTTAFTFWGLQFYSGIDSGLYNGSLSITYNYVPIRRDSDGDGLFDDEDECPNTPPGAIVDEHGCSIDQLVPCEGPKEGGSWKNHGQYVSTFGKEITKFVEEGRINETEAEAMAELAAQCDCGKKR